MSSPYVKRLSLEVGGRGGGELIKSMHLALYSGTVTVPEYSAKCTDGV